MRKNKSLSRQMRDEANKFFDENIKHSLSNRQYRRDFKKFVEFCRSKGLKSLSAGKNLIVEYCDFLCKKNTYTASSIHTFLAPVCRFYGVSMKEVYNKPKRLVSKYTKGRVPRTDRYRKYSDLSHPYWEKITRLQMAVGLRKSELANLRGCDLHWEGKENYCFVRVRKGKGGKQSDYLIMPADIPLVTSYFKNKDPEEFIFDRKYIKNNSLNLHSLRAKHAQNFYFYLLEHVNKDPGFRGELKKLVVRKWEEQNINPKTGKPKKFDNKNLSGWYQLRGGNKLHAIEHGKPTRYDRLCMCATSVLALAHFRLSIVPTYLVMYD